MEQQIDVLTLFSKFASQVEKGKKLPPITLDAKIRDFGIDSVAMMEIIGCFEDEFNVRIPDEKLAMLESVGDIQRVILEQSKAGHA